ncbi:hypothetical protein IJI94_00010 [Candidatus Saccharibacteria bacterium]|nr:hypothetical protein [Candidatus Saccharibacteria bacterium]
MRQIRPRCRSHEPPDFEIYEIQAKTCAEVAGFSACYAADKLNKPCIKYDTGLYIEALAKWLQAQQ